jgi:hypothetical protein
MLSSAADDHGAQSARLREPIERRQEPADQLAVIGIVARGAIEDDAGNATPIDVEKNARVRILCGHANLHKPRRA